MAFEVIWKEATEGDNRLSEETLETIELEFIIRNGNIQMLSMERIDGETEKTLDFDDIEYLRIRII